MAASRVMFVAERIEADHPVAALGKRSRQRILHLAREQEAGHEQDGVFSLTIIVEHEPLTVVLELTGPGFAHRNEHISGTENLAEQPTLG